MISTDFMLVFSAWTFEILRKALTLFVDLSLSTVTRLFGTKTSPFLVCFIQCSLVSEIPSDSQVIVICCPCRTVSGVLGLKTKWFSNPPRIEIKYPLPGGHRMFQPPRLFAWQEYIPASLRSTFSKVKTFPFLDSLFYLRSSSWKEASGWCLYRRDTVASWSFVEQLMTKFWPRYPRMITGGWFRKSSGSSLRIKYPVPSGHWILSFASFFQCLACVEPRIS